MLEPRESTIRFKTNQYGHLLRETDGYYDATILSVSQFFLNEGRALLYSRNTFEFDSMLTLKAWLDADHGPKSENFPSRTSCIRKLSILAKGGHRPRSLWESVIGQFTELDRLSLSLEALPRFEGKDVGRAAKVVVDATQAILLRKCQQLLKEASSTTAHQILQAIVDIFEFVGSGIMRLQVDDPRRSSCRHSGGNCFFWDATAENQFAKRFIHHVTEYLKSCTSIAILPDLEEASKHSVSVTIGLWLDGLADEYDDEGQRTFHKKTVFILPRAPKPPNGVIVFPSKIVRRVLDYCKAMPALACREGYDAVIDGFPTTIQPNQDKLQLSPFVALAHLIDGWTLQKAAKEALSNNLTQSFLELAAKHYGLTSPTPPATHVHYWLSFHTPVPRLTKTIQDPTAMNMYHEISYDSRLCNRRESLTLDYPIIQNGYVNGCQTNRCIYGQNLNTWSCAHPACFVHNKMMELQGLGVIAGLQLRLAWDF